VATESTGLDIAYDELKESYNRLRDREARLNTEATFILGSASIVVGAVSGILNQTGIGTRRAHKCPPIGKSWA